MTHALRPPGSPKAPRVRSARYARALTPSSSGSAPMLRASVEELRQLLDDRAEMLREARNEQRQRAERAERDLDDARAEVERFRRDSGTADTPGTSRRRRGGQPAAGE